jgi:hypothetical protein
MGFLSTLGTIGGTLLGGGPVGGMIGGALGGLLDSSQQADSVQSASNAQQASTDASIGEQRRQFDLTRSDYAPYREAGTKALGQLQTDIGTMPTSQEVMNSPGYQFGLTQGQQAIDRKTAAAGGRVSGAALKSAAEYGTNYATTGYNAEYQRRQDRLNRLASLAGVGQSATGSSAAAGSNMANNVSNSLSSQGDATGAARIAQGNIWANNGNQLAATAQNWAKGYQQNNAQTNPAFDSYGLNVGGYNP